MHTIKNSNTTALANIRKALTGLIIGLIFMTTAFGCGSLVKGMTASAQTKSSDYKYYTSVRISSGDTLYSIAERYYSEEYYGDMEEYLKEVCRTNHIDDRDRMIAGDYIIMPYYAAYVPCDTVIE